MLWPKETNSSNISVDATFNAADFVQILLVLSHPKINKGLIE